MLDFWNYLKQEEAAIGQMLILHQSLEEHILDRMAAVMSPEDTLLSFNQVPKKLSPGNIFHWSDPLSAIKLDS